MTKTETHAWRLDALDSLGGLAFASYRISELEADALDAAIPAVFFGAPTFQPVSLTSRLGGLAASRRSFQAGLFIGGDEVGFPELEDAIEFVRRCYVRGGGGAGSGPAGGPLPRPEGGPDFPPPPTLGRTVGGELDKKAIRLTDLLVANLKQYSILRKDLDSKPPGQSTSMMWCQPPGAPLSSALPRVATPYSVYGVEVPYATTGVEVTRGAVRLLDEMIRRVPVHSTDPEELMNWLVAYHRLVWAICKMGIWPFVSRKPYKKHLGAMFGALRRFAVNRRSSVLYQWIRSLGRIEPFLIWDLPWRASEREWTDAIDDLHQGPVPSSLAQALSSPGNNRNPTLLNFLAAFLAKPPEINGSPSLVPEIDVALFAAARIVSPCARNWADRAGNAFSLPGSWGPGSIHHRMLVRLAQSASAWLAGQLPRRVFGSTLEQAIEQTSSLVAA